MGEQFKFRDGVWIDTRNEGHTVQDAAAFLAAAHAPSPAELIAMDGWCGCGQPELVIEALHKYLSLLPNWEHGGWEAVAEACGGQLTHDLLAYRADELGLTEHGGSVGGAWLTDAGKAWLAMYAHEAASSEGPE